MNNGMPIQHLAAELQRQLASKADFVATSNAIQPRVVSGHHMLAIPDPTTGYQAMQLTEHAHGQLAEHLGLRKDYYDRMRKNAPELWENTVRTWLSQSEGRRLVRTLDGNIRALLSDSYQRIDNWDVVNAGLPAMLEAGLVLRSSSITEQRVYLKATSPSIVLPVPGSRRVGDLVEAGVMIGNSETGSGALSVSPFYAFLFCTNGMSRTELAWRKAHVGRKIEAEIEGFLSEDTRRLEDLAVLSKVKDLVKAALDFNRFRADIEKMGGLTQTPVRPEETIVKLADAHQLTNGEQQSILDHLLKGGDMSAWGMVNAVTRTAEDMKNYDRASELEALGGKLIDLKVGEWAAVVE